MKVDKADIVGLVGVGLFVAGVARLSIAAALMVAGLICCGWSYVTAIIASKGEIPAEELKRRTIDLLREYQIETPGWLTGATDGLSDEVGK